MRKRQIGCALVVDDQGKPIGKFTQRQLMRMLLEHSGQLDAPVRGFMYADADPIALETPIARLVELMGQRQIRYLAVVDQEGKVVGLTGQKGLQAAPDDGR